MQLCVGNGACEVIQALLARNRGPLLISLPTFSAYYEFAAGPLVTHQLDATARLPCSTSTSSTRSWRATRPTPS